LNLRPLESQSDRHQIPLPCNDSRCTLTSRNRLKPSPVDSTCSNLVDAPIAGKASSGGEPLAVVVGQGVVALLAAFEPGEHTVNMSTPTYKRHPRGRANVAMLVYARTLFVWMRTTRLTPARRCLWNNHWHRSKTPKRVCSCPRPAPPVRSPRWPTPPPVLRWRAHRSIGRMRQFRSRDRRRHPSVQLGSDTVWPPGQSP
jgi:hypothetical protein